LIARYWENRRRSTRYGRKMENGVYLRSLCSCVEGLIDGGQFVKEKRSQSPCDASEQQLRESKAVGTAGRASVQGGWNQE